MIPRIALATAILAALPGAPAPARDMPPGRDCVASGCLGIAAITATPGTDPAWRYEVRVENRSPTDARAFRIAFSAPGATATAHPGGYLLRGGQSHAFPLGHSARRIPDEVLREATRLRCLA